MRSAVILRLRIWMIGKNISGLNVTRFDMRLNSQWMNEWMNEPGLLHNHNEWEKKHRSVTDGDVVTVVTALCGDGGHAVVRSQNGARHQQHESPAGDAALAALARCGAMAAAGNGFASSSSSGRAPGRPPARAVPARPTAPPPPPPPTLPPNGIRGDCRACDAASERASVWSDPSSMSLSRVTLQLLRSDRRTPYLTHRQCVAYSS